VRQRPVRWGDVEDGFAADAVAQPIAVERRMDRADPRETAWPGDRVEPLAAGEVDDDGDGWVAFVIEGETGPPQEPPRGDGLPVGRRSRSEELLHRARGVWDRCATLESQPAFEAFVEQA